MYPISVDGEGELGLEGGQSGRWCLTLSPLVCVVLCSDDPFLYTREANPVLYASRFDPDAPDFDSFPLARQAKPVECIVKPGELLYLPAGWFHHVRALEASLSANRWAKDLPMAVKRCTGDMHAN